MMQKSDYIHGTHSEEQSRLSLLNDLTNTSFLAFMDIRQGDSILEVGSGPGILANRVAEAFPNSHITGVEIAAEYIDKARADFVETPNLEFIEGDAQSLNLQGSLFDVVYCRYVLEHVQNPLGVVLEMFRVLKKGGRIFAQENNILINALYPDCPSYSLVLGKFAELQSRMGGDAEIGRKLFSLMKQVGFRSIALSLGPEVHHYDMPTFKPWIANSIEILKGAKSRLLELDGVPETLFQKAVSELDELRENTYGSAYFYWNRATAVKP
jgi:ubiquinone/menaquinone biosynthesis C-methylase UbiE